MLQRILPRLRLLLIFALGIFCGVALQSCLLKYGINILMKDLVVKNNGFIIPNMISSDMKNDIAIIGTKQAILSSAQFKDNHQHQG